MMRLALAKKQQKKTSTIVKWKTFIFIRCKQKKWTFWNNMKYFFRQDWRSSLNFKSKLLPFLFFLQVNKLIFFAYWLKNNSREKKRVESFQMNKTFCLILTKKEKKKNNYTSFALEGVLIYVKNGRREKILRRREKIIVVTPHPRNRSIVTHTNIRQFVPYLNQYSESSQRKKKSDVLWKFRYHNCVMKSSGK